MSGIDSDTLGADAPQQKTRFNFWKLSALFLFACYFLHIAFFYTDQWCLLDGMNIWVHEAGHFFFSFSGSDFLTILGGTLLQLLVPLVFVLYFYSTSQNFSAALTVFWLGESLINVSVYMADAVTMQLPLLGGGTEGHDWHNLFSMLGLLPQTAAWSFATHTLGVLVILLAIVLGIASSREKQTVLFNNRSLD